MQGFIKFQSEKMMIQEIQVYLFTMIIYLLNSMYRSLIFDLEEFFIVHHYSSTLEIKHFIEEEKHHKQHLRRLSLIEEEGFVEELVLSEEQFNCCQCPNKKYREQIS